MIASLSNQKVKRVVQLQNKAPYRKKEGLFVAEGIKMFLEAPASLLEEVYLSEHFFDLLKDKTAETAIRTKLKDCSWENVSGEVFKKMADTQSPQGILCILKQPSYRIGEMTGGCEPPFLLLLENLQDPGNLGTILRTAEGAGVSGVIMGKDTVDIYNPKTIRATMGSVYRVPFLYADQLEETASFIRGKGIRVYAAHLKGKGDYDSYSYRGGCAFLIGNEARGLSRELSVFADEYVKIPMKGSVESLNASVAAALLMYEAARQRKQ